MSEVRDLRRTAQDKFVEEYNQMSLDNHKLRARVKELEEENARLRRPSVAGKPVSYCAGCGSAISEDDGTCDCSSSRALAGKAEGG